MNDVSEANPSPADADMSKSRDVHEDTNLDPAVNSADTVEVDFVAQLQGDLDAANDRVLRVQAELDNYRKRVRREMDEERRYAQMPIIRDLLSVVDNLERALAATTQTENKNLESLLEGVELVTTQLKSVLDRHHCQLIVANEGSLFDPHCHEAISQQPSYDQAAGTVMHVAQRGYQLHDRVVRPVQVVVSTGSTQDAITSPQDETASPQDETASPQDGTVPAEVNEHES